MVKDCSYFYTSFHSPKKGINKFNNRYLIAITSKMNKSANCDLIAEYPIVAQIEREMAEKQETKRVCDLVELLSFTSK
jgi:hypothetical protein